MTEPTGGAPAPSIPQLIGAALGQTITGIATGITEAGAPDPISVRRRWATVLTINTDSTVDIDLGGVTIPHVSYDASYHPALNEVVQVNVVDTDITVIGPTANATYVAYIRRTGTIVKVNTAGTAPGAPTSVNVTLSDAQVPVTILNVPFVSEYYPTVNDEVSLGQGTNTNIYLVLGAVNRTFRRPTGDIEPSILNTAKPNTLLLQGQTVSRTTYAALWAWVQINGLAGVNLPFGTGDGSTTFTLPDFRGRVPVGAGPLGSDTYTLGVAGGAARANLTTAQMPSHTHGVSASQGAHSHTFSDVSDVAGGHAHSGTTGSMDRNWNHGHSIPVSFSTSGAHSHAGAAGSLAEAANPNNGGNPNYFTGGTDTNHLHNFDTSSSGGHSHNIGGTTSASQPGISVSESAVGSGSALDLRQPYLAVNWLIWV